MTPMAAMFGAIVIALAGDATQAASPSPIEIKVLSSDAARVSGGNALVDITASANDLAVTLNGTDVSKAFAAASADGHRRAVIGGLKVGDNTLIAKQGGASATAVLKNHPITGPVFAGPKEKPFFCDTTSFKLFDGSTLPAAADADCSLKTQVLYAYMPKGAKKLSPLPKGNALPADVAETTTSAGAKVPYVVRLEIGTIDRGIYQMAVLHDPTKESEPTPAAPPKAWNKRFVYTFSGGCQGMYRQGPTTGDVLDDQFVKLGYVTMSNSLNVFANNCDDLLSSEAVMMTREHAIKTLGVPFFTMGFGCSGASHQQLQTVQNYPGLLDGIVPSCNSVDYFRLIQFGSDMGLVVDWFKTPAAAGLTEDQKLAINGELLNAAATSRHYLEASNCPAVVPKDQIFDPVKNPKGVRCTQSDHTVNVIGRDPKTGYGRPTIDNVGVQYGLGALNDRKITVKTFLDLNDQIGGFDVNGAHTAARSVGDVEGITNAYRTGRVVTGGAGLMDVPILELRNYSDRDKDAGHMKSATYALMGRVEHAQGNRDNYVILLESHRNGDYSASRSGGDDMSHYGIGKMDNWLTAIINDKGAGSRREKVIRNKPADLVDSCYDDEGQRVVEKQTFAGGRCNALYPTYPTPRMVAGTPVSQDIVKCQLKPIDVADYKVSFTPAERERLGKIFAQGVCDWSKPGVGQVPLAGTWQTF